MALRADGWRPTPFRQFIVKLHGKCNLACDYCYVYAMGDESWRSRPAQMSLETVGRVAQRIAEHATAHGLEAVQIVLHGGEPLLAGRDTVRQAVGILRAALPQHLAVGLSVQTNGLLLDAAFLRLLDQLDVRVGVSIDGAPDTHDKHRTFAHGGGSHAAVARALRLLRSAPFRRLFAGLLCTIDVTADPLGTYEALLEFEPPAIDFLLPHGSWTRPPPFRVPGSAQTAYADWLIAVFDRWYGAKSRETDIRLFSELIHLVLGGRSRVESVGLSPVAVIVIETDGSLEQVDTLRSAFPGAPETGLNVSWHSFDAALDHPAIAARQIGAAALCEECLGCGVRNICGGGYYPHRYQAGTGFRHPSVYCPDLLRLIRHVQHRVEATVSTMPLSMP